MPVEKIKALFQDSSLSKDELRSRLNETDHFEISRRLHEFSPDEKIKIFHLLDSERKRQELLYEMDPDSRREIQDSLDREDLAKLFKGMAEDEVTDILQELPEENREEILEKMPPKDAGIIKDLITYGEETAGGLMELNFNKVWENQTAADILLKLKRERNQDTPPYFYVVNRGDQLLGFFKLRDLLNVPVIARPTEFMRQKPPKVLLNDPCEKVANLMDHEHLSSIPVVDQNNVIQGVVTFDDVIRAMQDIASEDIFTMVGTDTVDPFAKKTIRKIRARAPWLFTTFIGGLISATVLGAFKNTLSDFAAIILFIPFVIGLAGNVAIQGATVIVRGMATGDIQSDNIKTVVKSELLVGISNGLIFGTLCGIFITLISQPLIHTNPLLGLTVGMGIILAVGISSVIGSLTPIIFLKMGIDPAISAGPIVTGANDIIGLLVYLSTAGFVYSFT
ncbi:MAG: magnesium transporter [Nitrospinaceae bacterium]